MKTLEYTTVDKSNWPKRGPWDKEVDKKQWQDETTGLPCLIHRGPHGGWCGYVGVSQGHPDFKKGYDHVDAEAHGGLTYADFCQPTKDESHGICHLPEPGEPDHVWWLGFDCAHSGDISPSYDRDHNSAPYRALAHARRMVHRLPRMSTIPRNVCGVRPREQRSTLDNPITPAK